MASSFLAGQYIVHQAFWPSGLWASLDDKPYTYDIEKAKALLAKYRADPAIAKKHKRLLKGTEDWK